VAGQAVRAGVDRDSAAWPGKAGGGWERQRPRHAPLL